MENYIESRVILGFLCLIQLFVACAVQYPWRPIKRKVLDGIILTELVVVTAYIVYDNLQIPPYDGWFIAILGYLFVYCLIFITWIFYRIFTFLDETKIYEMTIIRHVHLMDEYYLQGTVQEENSEHEVYLPYSSELDSLIKKGIKPKVKFDNVFKGSYIIVKYVPHNN